MSAVHLALASGRKLVVRGPYTMGCPQNMSKATDGIRCLFRPVPGLHADPDEGPTEPSGTAGCYKVAQGTECNCKDGAAEEPSRGSSDCPNGINGMLGPGPRNIYSPTVRSVKQLSNGSAPGLCIALRPNSGVASACCAAVRRPAPVGV
jgi:hypothetical protein